MSEERMPFLSHLEELRKRILLSLVAIIVGFIISFTFTEELFKAVTLPLNYDLIFKTKPPFISFLLKPGGKTNLVFVAPAEAFWVQMKVAMIAGTIIAIPIILLQIWLFVAPGLMPNEKKYVLPFIIAGSGLFAFGAAFCFAVVLPFAMRFLMTYNTSGLTPMISIGSYVDFILKFIVSFGAIFELPILLIVLTRIGIVTPKKLADFRKYAIVLAFVVAGVLTPTPDAFNQTLMAGPIILLYEIGIFTSRFFYRKPASVETAVEPQDS